MKRTILLNYGENTHQIEDEEKARFIRDILEQCFENTSTVEHLHSIWEKPGPLPVVKKIELRQLLTHHNILIIDDEGQLNISLDNEKIGRFEKPTYKLLTDLNIPDPRKRVYLEMLFNCWSIFDKEAR